jgi:hypothetical protein
MSFSNSVTRRYTPPTCTLEISAKDSPLTRWMGRSALKHLRFKLSFDDPRVSDDRWITVRGDRTQIESLSQVVTTYVQQFLSQSTALLNAAHSGTPPNLSQSATASTLSVMSRPASQDAHSAETNPARISIQPSGILSHELFLGTLATEESGASIRLSAVQLADLASALDEYAADVTALPNLNRPAWSKSPQWTSLAATALIAFGLTASVLRMLDRSSQTQTVATSSQGASSSDQRLAVQPLPSSSSPSPSALLPTAPPPLISLSPLAPSTTTAPPTTGTLPKITVLPAPPANSVPVEPPPGLTIQPAPSGDRSYPVSPVPNSLRAGNSKRIAPNSSAASQSAAEERTAIAPSSTNGTNRADSSRSLDRDSTAFDTIPQVAEVRQFFQKRWQPRPELTEKLQYIITLNADGSIRNVDALNQAAGDYIDRTGMPPWSEPFVSPLKGRNSAVIRVVLSPDGTVQTFLQSGSGQ